MRDLASLVLMLTGAFFMFVAAVGVVRMPDLFLRMSATSKSATLGAACMLLAAAVHFNDFGITTRVLATIAFLLLTAPVAAHRIGRAAYFLGVPLWRGTVRDDLRGKYGENSRLQSTPHTKNGENTKQTK
ncbi:MAG: monovalent cation/H(+) antiporter subunit G [Acidobacteria bacterium]|nr:monovalent cation/H(+) antiporter subunit G [Acidobacteriota bacterium]MCW5968937.1 monovalent cation/H(+) antiporter subunit G [Blastocatellales bacterium]